MIRDDPIFPQIKMQQIQHYINGEFIDGTQNIESMNPSTGKTYCLVPVGESDHVDKAVKAAKDAFKSWSKKSKFERSAHLMKIADLITQRIPEFALAESSEQGKPLSLSLSLDIPRAVDNFRFFATAILHEQSAFSEALPGFQSYVLQQVQNFLTPARRCCSTHFSLESPSLLTIVENRSMSSIREYCRLQTI